MARKNEAHLAHITPQLRPLAVPVADLNPDPANARLHPERNLASIEASLRVYRQLKPLVVRREGMVVVTGNGTLAAAKRLGWTHIAVVLVDHDPITALGFSLADNRSAELATWDQALLGQLMAELDAAEVDLDPHWIEAELKQLQGVVPAFEPTSEDDQHDLDKLAPKFCPHCGMDIRQPPAREREAS